MEQVREIGKSRVYEFTTSMHKGYLYDMPVVRYTLSDYTTGIKTPFVFNISNEQIN